MIKVAHLTFDMRIGGTEQVIMNIVNGERDNDINHRILCIEMPLGPFGQRLLQQGITIDSWHRSDGFDRQLIANIRQYLHAHKIDILHCHQYTPWSYGTLAAIGLKTKVIFTEHGRFYPDSSSWKRKIINPILAYFTEHITAISNATRNALTEYEFIRAEQIKLVYNGIAPLSFSTEDEAQIAAHKQTYQLPEDALVLGTIARMDPIKNHELMIKVCAEINRTGVDCRLVIVGDGEQRPHIEQTIKDEGMLDKVILTGYKSKPKCFFGLFDIFLLTSFSEGTSMTLLEAMSLGIPSVVTNVGGNPEVIQDQRSGIVVPSDDVAACTAAVLSIYASPQIQQSFADNARADFTQHFHVDVMNQSFNQIYKSCQ